MIFQSAIIIGHVMHHQIHDLLHRFLRFAFYRDSGPLFENHFLKAAGNADSAKCVDFHITMLHAPLPTSYFHGLTDLVHHPLIGSVHVFTTTVGNKMSWSPGRPGSQPILSLKNFQNPLFNFFAIIKFIKLLTIIFKADDKNNYNIVHDMKKNKSS